MSALSMLLLLPGCDTPPQAIDYGKDECSECKMILVDQHYGTELITGKGKVYKFDDVNCMVEFIRKEPAKNDTDAKRLIIDFDHGNQFLNVEDAVFLKHKDLRSPMGSHTGAFATGAAAAAANDALGGGGAIMTWTDVLKEP